MQPISTNALTSFTVEVSVSDFAGNFVTDFNGNGIPISLSLLPSGSSTNAGLMGAAQAATVNGKATFGVSVSNAGVGFGLMATAPGLTNALSNAFTINGVTSVIVGDRRSGNVVLDNLARTWASADYSLPTVYAALAFVSASGSLASNEQQFVSIRLADNPYGVHLNTPDGTLTHLMTGSIIFAFDVTQPGYNFTLEIVSEQFRAISAQFNVT